MSSVSMIRQINIRWHPLSMERTRLSPPAIKIAPSYRSMARQIGLGPFKSGEALKIIGIGYPHEAVAR